MAKKIQFQLEDGKEYRLEFTRRTATELQAKGFNLNELTDKPLLVLPELFAGAFLANHRYVKREKINSIFEKFTNKLELVGKLAEMFNEPLNTLLEEPEEEMGNVKWTMTE